MSGLEELVQAARSVPPERREEALRVLKGDPPEPLPPPAGVEERPDEILTLEELSARLRLSVWTVRRLVKRRVISSLRTGRVLRFHWPTVKHRLGAGEPALSQGNPSSGPGKRGRFVHH